MSRTRRVILETVAALRRLGLDVRSIESIPRLVAARRPRFEQVHTARFGTPSTRGGRGRAVTERTERLTRGRRASTIARVPPPAAEALYEHLCLLRDADEPTHPRHAASWRVVSRWLAQAYPGTRRELEDARQEALVSLMRSVKTMRAEGPLQAAKWVGIILRRKRIDLARANVHDPIEQALRAEPKGEHASAPIDRLEAREPLDPGAIPELVDVVLEQVHRALEESETNAAKRQLRRTQAQAALLRLVLDEDADAIAAALDHGEPLSKERIYKWVERGRPVVCLGLDRWERDGDPDAARVIAVLRETMDERRADAGVPRPERRKGRAEDPR